MTENKYSWLSQVFKTLETQLTEAWEKFESAEYDDEIEDYTTDYENAYYKAKQAIIAKIEAEKVEARIDEWKEFQWAHDVSDTIKDIVYVNYIKDRVSGLKMELGELTKELKEDV